MADPLRRTLLAKLRGKKNKKGETLRAGLGLSSATAATAATANEGREGKEKVLQMQREPVEAHPVVVTLSGMDYAAAAERMSTYENCFDGPVAQSTGVDLLRLSASAEIAGSRPPLLSSGGTGRLNGQLPGAGSLHFAIPDAHAAHWEHACDDTITMSFGETTPGRRRKRRKKYFISVPWQCSVGDSIGFGDNSYHIYSYAPSVHRTTSRCQPLVQKESASVLAVNTARKANEQSLDTANPVPAQTEETFVEILEPAHSGDSRGRLRSPAFFPTELHLCDISVASVVKHPLDSEDDDYYDNEILPFYESRRKSAGDGGDVMTPPPQMVQDEGQADESRGAQETDRLRNQLKEAYYLLINAMNGIHLEQQALSQRHSTSSCSSRSRDSLCSGARNVDSDSWSSGGAQPVSDTDSLLLCLAGGNIQSGLKSRLDSKSLLNLSSTQVKATLVRSASEGDIRRPLGPLQRIHPLGKGPDLISELRSDEDSDDAEVRRAHELPPVFNAGDHDEPFQAVGEVVESSGSLDSLTGSSDGNPDGWAPPAHDNKLAQGGNLVNKGYGVTVNKMQEWMHKGRLLSSEMKQRIEGPCHRASPTVKSLTSPASKTAQLSALTENAPWQEAARANELSAWRPHLHTITVGKKRNWLQQSTLGNNHCTKDELQAGKPGAEEELGLAYSQPQQPPPPPPPPSPSPEQLTSSGGAPPASRPAHLHLPEVSVDPAEENDADDEGEIWYNPIPEDDEPEVSNRASVRLLDSNGRTLESGGPDSLGEGNAGHWTDRQKAQEEGGPCTSKSVDVPDFPNSVGFSPPSSPNPTKKSSSINWSFPDKIKSPRTVRKLSMKMKKLPELSRKLSVKGQSSGGGGNGGAPSEPRSQSLRAPAVGIEATCPQRSALSGAGLASRNVISRYHLDSSVSTQHSFGKKKNNGGGAGVGAGVGGGGSKSASKGGYLSDGDSPELVAKSGKRTSVEAKECRYNHVEGASGSSKANGTDLDIDAFRHYSFTEQPKCSQYISGLMSLHFYGAEDLKPPRVDSRDVYCAIQVDSVNKARTALLTCRTTFLGMDHTFNIELENAQHLKLVVFSWEPTPRRNRVCCHGTVVLPALFRVIRSHQLAVKLEPRGLIYVKLNLMEHWQNSLDGGADGGREHQVFGVEAWRVVEREDTGLPVPLLISKCITEIEKRGCQVVGLYRLCGSAAVKKELREAFERDSYAVGLCENTYPDINVITGVLKDYLRELPYPLITKQLYEAVLDSMAARPLRMGAAGCENDHADSEHTVGLLDILPEVERMTLRKLLDHLKLVASYQEVNKMTCQNLAVCFGPVLLSQRQEASCHTNRVFIDSEELASALHFKKHIEVLHYLLQLWPVVDLPNQPSSPEGLDSLTMVPPLRRRKERPHVLNLTEAGMAGVLRPKAGRLDSPSNRYAGDWSGCGDSYFPAETLPLPHGKEEADYDDVPSEDTDGDEGLEKPDCADDDAAAARELPGPDEHSQTLSEEEDVVAAAEEEQPDETDEDEAKQDKNEGSGNRRLSEEKESACEHILPRRLHKEHAYQTYMKIQDISPVLSNRVNLRDLQESIDTLIGNLERELNKNKINVGY
ncbi:rho GTPase-activating protein SYDE2 isoform X2 [Syngnathus scovelli]|uniref:rho GTPase-activating protein SYDE2 isoform X2 n=1 Tax=Syngnathus scovelli TaxID=161590 RepID=UPI00210F8DC7|nr:rho GTPase-activating protein SYDE2 isoform X2 [Syngnathus scovelli]